MNAPSPPPSSSSSSIAYRPTPLERAYTSHLLATHFSTPFYLNSPTQSASHDNVETIRVSGRNAVPFLTTSGVERSLLRLIWSISDPEGVGTLLKRNQFYVILRLVAMAQAHFLPPLPSELSDGEKMHILKETLERNAHLVVALPTFDADKGECCPSVAKLMGTYPPPADAKSNGSSAPALDFSSENMSNMWGSNQNNQIIGGSEEVIAMTVSDAFGSMEVEDRPLPSLMTSPVLEDPKSLSESDNAPSAVALVEEGEDDFGDFDDAPVQQGTDGPIGASDDFGNFDHGSAPMAVESNFGEFDNAIPPPPPPIESMNAAENIVSEEGEDDFGGFASVSNEHEHENQAAENAAALVDDVDNNDDIQTESSAEDVAAPMEEEGGDVSFGAFGDFEAVPPANDDNVMSSMSNDIGIEGGMGFGTGTMAGLPPLNNAGDGAGAGSDNTLSISDAFGSLVEQQQQQNDAPVDMAPATEGGIDNGSDGDGDGFGDFGDFEEVNTNGQTEEDDVHDNDDGDDGGFGDFEEITANQQQTEGSDDGFGNFGSSQEVPPPTAGMNMNEANANEEGGITFFNHQVSAAESDETPNNNPNPTGGHHLSVFDAMVDVQDAPLPPLGAFSSMSSGGIDNDDGNDAVAPVEEDDDFGDFAGQTAGDASVNDYDDNVSEEDNDDFGDFAGTDDADAGLEGEQAIAVADQEDGDTFGDFGGEQEDEINVDNDDFGGFEEVTAVENNEVGAIQEAVSEDGFGDFGDDAGQQSSVPEVADANAGNDEGDATSSDKVSSVFDALAEVPDAPLPPLRSFGAENTHPVAEEEEEDEDDLDDVATGSSVEEGVIEEDNQSCSKEEDNSHENFDDGALPQMEHDAEDDTMAEQTATADADDDADANDMNGFGFGTISGNPPPAAPDGDDKLSSALFDVFGEVQDAPLPGLGAFSSSSMGADNTAWNDNDVVEANEVAPATEEMDDYDGFGDFEDTNKKDAEDTTTTTETPQVVNNEDGVKSILDLYSQSSMDNSASLPPSKTLAPATSAEMTTVVNPNMEDDDEDGFGDFGDFEAPEEPTAVETDAHTADNVDETNAPGIVAEDNNLFGGFNDNKDTADLPMEGHSTNDDDLLFGDFSATPQRNAAGSSDAANVNVFDAFSEIPPPPLGHFPAAEQGGGEDDMFGDFSDNIPVVTGDNDNDDNFGQFEAFPAPATNDEVVQGTNNDESFGQFEAFPTAEATGEDTHKNGDDDNFGQFEALPIAATTNEEFEQNDNDNDDNFGQFDAFPTAELADEDVQKNNEEDDNSEQFEAFPAAAATNEEVQQNDIDSDDNFGQFDAFPTTEPPDENVQKNGEEDDNSEQSEAFPAAAATNGEVQQNDIDNDDNFGQFDAFPTTESPNEDGQNNSEEDDNVGGFEAFAASTSAREEVQNDNNKDENFGQFGNKVEQNDNNEDESFGQFEAFPADVAPDEDVLKNNNDEDDNFGQFNADEEDMTFGDFEEGPESVISAAADKVEDFGNFDEVKANGDSAQPGGNNPSAATAEGINNTNADESFGQFEAFPSTSAAEQHIDDKDKDFGQFEAHTNPEEAAQANVDDFGTFEESSSVQNSNAPAVAAGDVGAVSESNNFEDDFGDDDGFGDFSSFEDAATPSSSSRQLADDGQSSDNKSKHKGNLEEILRRDFGHECGKLPSDWKNVIISSIESDLQRGNKIMDYLSNNLSSKDRLLMVKSKKLRDHVFGLAEFVRVVRFISASIGELLGVDKNVEVHESTLSQWYNNPIIADVIVIEYLWSEIISKAVALGICSSALQLESVVEIRSAQQATKKNKDNFCQLTLRPLEEGLSCTRSPVVWKGKRYMACAANFCANRLPEHAI